MTSNSTEVASGLLFRVVSKQYEAVPVGKNCIYPKPNPADVVNFLRSTALLFAMLLVFTTAPVSAQDGSGYEIEHKDNGTVVETYEIGNTTYRTTTTPDGTVYESQRTEVGSTTYYEGTSSEGWSYEGRSTDYGSMSNSSVDYYDSSGSFTGSSETTTYEFGGSSTTTYEGFDGTDYSYETETNIDFDYD